MPLTSSDDIPTSISGKTFFIFYASRDEHGRMWCPDCRDVEALVQRTFALSSENGVIIYVGQKHEWKMPGNKFRAGTYGINAIPTILRVEEGKETGRLVEGDILESDRLDQFII